MKMNESSPIPPVGTSAPRTAGATRSEGKDELEAPQETVSVSRSTEALQAVRATVASGRSQLVQEIIAAVKRGQYYPSPQQIAQQLVSAAEVEAAMRALML